MRRAIIARACASSVVVCWSMWFATSVSAGVLLPGTTLYRPGSGSPTYTVGGVPSEYAYVADSEWISPITGDLEGNVVSRLYQNTAGEYAFLYQLFNASANGSVFTSATISDDDDPWKGIAISNAGTDQNGLSVGDWSDGSPLAISRDSTARGEGLRLTFLLLNNGVTLNSPTGKSSEIWVVTDATSYAATRVAILNGGHTGSAGAYAPVPEPGTLPLLVVTGLIGIGMICYAWRKKK